MIGKAVTQVAGIHGRDGRTCREDVGQGLDDGHLTTIAAVVECQLRTHEACSHHHDTHAHLGVAGVGQGLVCAHGLGMVGAIDGSRRHGHRATGDNDDVGADLMYLAGSRFLPQAHVHACDLELALIPGVEL